jgi:hypothetical protein
LLLTNSEKKKKKKRTAMLEVSQYPTSNYTQSHSSKKQHGTYTKNIYEDQWNRMEALNMNSHSYAHLIFDKGAKNIVSSTNVAGKSFICMQKTETTSMPITLYW